MPLSDRSSLITRPWFLTLFVLQSKGQGALLGDMEVSSNKIKQHWVIAQCVKSTPTVQADLDE